ncbi:phosphatidate cytidylyltransferase [Erwinia sp. E602]|uniref:phosphatidate cytidylyltransferase n=1 Tax=unclassified Erwinia TaxID=2622719 RepID=UPI0006FAE491|nr:MULTISPECIES: phosphatidate cytidylyltransferase [unclassified Erwinia]KQN58210.1 CDP-diglyceride synthetase [Erwinia sp. Leaf53]PLV57279.1 CDP-diglyceride synthetase [Erwinia sp. B116]QUG77023.1 phosphatidate cytidylyltransferase [Erwinia sp. E602]
MLKSRLITALILIPIVIAALFLLPPLGFAIVILAICMLAAWEWGQFAGFAARSQRIWLAVLCGLLLSLMLFTLPAWQSALDVPQIGGALWISLIWWLAALLLVLRYPGSAAFWRSSKPLRLLFGLLTIVPFFCGMLVLRQYHYATDHYAGAWWLLYVMVLVWGADSGAYMFGKLFGKHKLAPKVSPGKTWEGFLGGLVTSALISWLFSVFAPLQVDLSTLLICSIAAALASVLGDLTESMFKREAGIKDSGSLIPGHGGILDRIDSLTAAVPVFACLLLLVFGAL